MFILSICADTLFPSAFLSQACLRMFETRETRNGALWYHKLGTEAVRGLASPQTPVWQLHGYVIALSELLCSSGEFMVARQAKAPLL